MREKSCGEIVFAENREGKRRWKLCGLNSRLQQSLTSLPGNKPLNLSGWFLKLGNSHARERATESDVSKEDKAAKAGEIGSFPAHCWGGAGDDARKCPPVFLLQCHVVSSQISSQVACTDVEYWMETQCI